MTGRKRGNWSVAELARLRVLYPHHREAEVARMLGRSVASVRQRAEQLLRRPMHAGPWSEVEDAQIRRSFGAVDLRALSLLLARPQREVQARIRHLRTARMASPFTRSEDSLLKRIFGSRSDASLVVCFSRPIAEIRARARALCLAKDKRFLATRSTRAGGSKRRMPRWTAVETAELRRLYGERENLEVARALGRSVVSVANKASQLGLKKKPAFLARLGRRYVALRHR